MAERLLTAAEVAELLAVPEGWVRDATRQGQLPHIRLGRYVRYSEGDVLGWVAEQKRGGAPAPRRRMP